MCACFERPLQLPAPGSPPKKDRALFDGRVGSRPVRVPGLQLGPPGRRHGRESGVLKGWRVVLYAAAGDAIAGGFPDGGRESHWAGGGGGDPGLDVSPAVIFHGGFHVGWGVVELGSWGGQVCGGVGGVERVVW